MPLSLERSKMINLKIDITPKHKISPYLYMQFMEPLSVTDSSVDAAWDFVKREWYPSVIDKVKELSPSMIRFGGCFASYYRWREGVGDYDKRPPMINYAWSGIYNNKVGTHEFIDFCRKVGAEPMIVANMQSEGLKFWGYPERCGTPEEAADWVSYCNDAENRERAANGSPSPFGVKYWQIGNETAYHTVSYDGTREYGFTADECCEVSARFAEAMRRRDESIKIIGWGDAQGRDGDLWGKKMSRVDGVDILAFHHHFDSGLENSPLIATKYRDDPEDTWRHLMNAYKSLDKRICEMRSIAGNKRLAITEGHFILPGRNRNEVLSSWAAGVAYARCLNVIMRNSDIIDIATMADFFGNVWQVNAIMIPTPIRAGTPYLQPVGAVMSLFGRYDGKEYAEVSAAGDIDAVASVDEDTCYLHAVNTDMNNSREIRLDIGRPIKSAVMRYVATGATVEITPDNTDAFSEREMTSPDGVFTLPPAAVAAIEIKF